IIEFEKRLTSQADESKSAEGAIERETARREERKAALAALVEERSKSASASNAAETELRDVRNSLSQLHDRRSSQQVRESQLQMKIDNLADNIQRRYHVDIGTFAPDQASFEKTLRVQLKRADKVEGGAPATPHTKGSKDLVTPITPLDDAELEKIISDLTQQLDNMGPVNLD